MSIDRGVYQSVKNSGKPAGLIGCDKTVVINTAASGTATIIAISGSTAIYVCGWEIMSSSASATNVNLSYGMGANCGTGTTVMSPLVRFPAGVTGLQGKVTYSPFWSGMNAQPGNGICIVNSADVQIDGIVYYTQF
jgi:hypothetical protein